MKPALSYSIVMSLGRPTVVAITSERAHRWWGRDCRTDLSTNGIAHSLNGRFLSRAEADACLEEVAAVKDHYKLQRAKLSDAHSRLHRAEEAMVRQVTQRLPARGAEMLVAHVKIVELKP